jgi:hypothetical protein
MTCRRRLAAPCPDACPCRRALLTCFTHKGYSLVAIRFRGARPLGSTVSVTYNYNSLIESVQNDVFSENEDDLFGLDILVREMHKTK